MSAELPQPPKSEPRRRLSMDLRILAHKSEMVELLWVLSAIQWCGSVGASRTIQVHVDGDGSGRVRFQWQNEKGDWEDIPNKPEEQWPKDGEKFWIGE